MAMASLNVKRCGVIIIFLFVSIITTVLSPLHWTIKHKLLRLQFLTIFHTIGFLVARSVWYQLTSSEKSLLTSRTSRSFFLLFLLLAQSSFTLGHFFTGIEPLWITLVAYLCSGMLLLIFFFLWLLESITFLGDLVSADFFKYKLTLRLKSMIAVYLSIFLCTVGFYTALKGPVVQRVTVPIHGLPSPFNGTRIVQLSDIHLGPTVGRSFLEHLVTLVNALDPDLVVITGDLVDLDPEVLKNSVGPLEHLTPKYGKFFVTGNHEYMSGDVDLWFDVLSKCGVQSLHNSHVTITHHLHTDDKFNLAGVDDIQARYKDHGMKLDQALEGLDSHIPTILLAHQPWAAYQAVLSGYHVNLILSGHTHGGQFFPMHIPIYLYNPYFRGLYHIAQKNMYVYVSSGTAYWGPPLRLGSTSEVSEITLVTSR